MLSSDDANSDKVFITAESNLAYNITMMKNAWKAIIVFTSFLYGSIGFLLVCRNAMKLRIGNDTVKIVRHSTSNRRII